MASGPPHAADVHAEQYCTVERCSCMMSISRSSCGASLKGLTSRQQVRVSVSAALNSTHACCQPLAPLVTTCMKITNVEQSSTDAIQRSLHAVYLVSATHACRGTARICQLCCKLQCHHGHCDKRRQYDLAVFVTTTASYRIHNILNS